MITYRTRLATLLVAAHVGVGIVSAMAAWNASVEAGMSALSSLVEKKARAAWEEAGEGASRAQRAADLMSSWGLGARYLNEAGEEMGASAGQGRTLPELGSGVMGRWRVAEGVAGKATARGLMDEGSAVARFEAWMPVSETRVEKIAMEAWKAALMAALALLAFGALGTWAALRHMRRTAGLNAEAVMGQIAMIEALGAAIAKRDSDTGAHNFKVAWVAARIGLRLGLKGRTLQALIAGSFLHDIGKIGIPDAILLKPGPLTDEEREIMRTHVKQGEAILGKIPWLAAAKEVVAGHHERWDGSGYPRGLSGGQISILARIFALADVFDALCSKRPYKDPMGFQETMALLEKSVGSHFDPRVMDAFRPIAKDVFDQLDGASEDECRNLLEDVLIQQFGIQKDFR